MYPPKYLNTFFSYRLIFELPPNPCSVMKHITRDNAFRYNAILYTVVWRLYYIGVIVFVTKNGCTMENM